METLSRALESGLVAACNIGRSGRGGFQVSVRREWGDGWEVYYGEDLAETVDRAINAGPQQAEDDWGGLV